MAAADETEESFQGPVDVKLCLGASLDGCQKALNWLWPARKVGTGPGEGKEPVLVPFDGRWTQVSRNPAVNELMECLFRLHDTSLVKTLGRLPRLREIRNGKKCRHFLPWSGWHRHFREGWSRLATGLETMAWHTLVCATLVSILRHFRTGLARLDRVYGL